MALETSMRLKVMLLSMIHIDEKRSVNMICDVVVKKLSGHNKDGKVGKISFKKGETIKAGDTILVIESNKGAVKLISEFTGVLKELTISEGDTVNLGQKIGEIDGEAGSSDTSVKQASKSGYSFGISKPKKEELNTEVLILGGGPGGYVAAIRLAQLGKSVVLVERDNLGGTCLNHGCIPTKAILSSTHLLDKIKKSEEYGINVTDFKADMNSIINKKNTTVENLVGGIDMLLEANGVRVIKGEGNFASENMLKVISKKIEADITFDKCVLATGSEPAIIPLEGHKLEGVINSTEILNLREIPESLSIIGGGVIGMEFAFMFASLGSKVTVVEFAEDILSIMDQDVIDVIKESAVSKNIDILIGTCASKIIEAVDGKLILEVIKNNVTSYIVSDKILMAVGRNPVINKEQMELIGVDLNDNGKGVKVNSKMETSNPNIYAIGDVTNIIQLAHVASHQGIVASENICGMDSHMKYDAVPSAVFTSPEIGTVGMSEKEAIKLGLDISVGIFPMAANGKANCEGEAEGFVKAICSADSNTIIGAAIVGHGASDMISTFTNAIEHKTSIQELIHVIYPHPTVSESIHEAILDTQGRMIHFVK